MKRIAAHLLRLATASSLTMLASTMLASTSLASTAQVEPSSTQHALVASLSEGRIDVNACASTTACPPQSGSHIDIPKDAAAPSAEIVRLSGGRQVMLVTAKARKGGARWVALLAPGAKQSAPVVHKLLRGWLGRDRLSANGTRRQQQLLREKLKGAERLVLSSHYQNADLCGRTTGLGAKELDPQTLSWKRSHTRSLNNQERSSATKLFAKRKTTPLKGDALRSLHVRLASSSLRGSAPQALSDGKLDVAWREAARGSGQGEFVVLTAPKVVPITGLELALHPPAPSGAKPDQQDASPRQIWIATRSAVFHITLPEDAHQQEQGVSYEVTLPSPIQTDCLGLVLDTAYEGKRKDPVVTLAELRAKTSFDSLPPEEVVGLLTGRDAGAIRALLLRSRGAILDAVVKGYDGLTRNGRDFALDVIEATPCSQVASFFVQHSLSTDDQGDTRSRFERGMKRCKTRAVPELLEMFRSDASDRKRIRAAHALATLSPAEVFQPIAQALTKATAKTRRGLRGSLSLSAQHRRARLAIDRWLGSESFASLDLVAQVDVLRSLENWLPKLQNGKLAFATTRKLDSSFRTRFLLLPAAGSLAAEGDAAALHFIRDSLNAAKQAHLRAQAASVAARLEPLRGDLVTRITDPHPRVRAASLQSLSAATTPLRSSVIDAVGRSLSADPWTFVRRNAAALLGTQPRTADSDEALIDALEDRRKVVRIASLRAMGQRKSHVAAQAIHDVADDPRQHASVRRAALGALAAMCRKDATPLLYKMALRAGPAIFPTDRELGLAALRALGEIRPKDLAERIAPLLDPKTPYAVRTLAKRTLASKGSCTPAAVASLAPSPTSALEEPRAPSAAPGKRPIASRAAIHHPPR